MKLLKDIIVGLFIAIITFLITYSFFFHTDEAARKPKYEGGKGHLVCKELRYCPADQPFEFHCCTDEEFDQAYIDGMIDVFDGKDISDAFHLSFPLIAFIIYFINRESLNEKNENL
ncbi:hypothetical protein ACFL3T_00330 [Patescibacteria group bacterium]